MKVVATGISGTGRGTFLSRVEELARAAGRSFRIFETGDMMFETASKLGIEIPQEKILDLSPSTLNFLRTTVFERIIRESKEVDDVVVSTHACFRWKKHLIQAFDFHYLNQIQPDMYVSIIDTITSIRARLERMPQWKGQLSMKEILVWRDEEVFITKSIADFQRKPFYIMPYREPPESMWRLMVNPSTPKAYLSYPMTHIGKEPEDMKKKDSFRDGLRGKGMIVFDPIDIEDAELLDFLSEAREKGEEEITYSKEGVKVTFEIKEATDVSDDIHNQIVSRDFQLIDQADMIVVYYFLPVMSPGVLSEMMYGFTNKKNVYVVFKGPESPFFKYYSTKIFHDEESLMTYLSEKGVLSSG